jgi:hypothetical protein
LENTYVEARLVDVEEVRGAFEVVELEFVEDSSE